MILSEGRGYSRKSSILLGQRQTSVFNRFIAKGIDTLIILAVYLLGKALWLPLGVTLAALLSAVQDSLGIGQSIGKRIIGLRVIDDETQSSCSLVSSVLRNAPLTVAILFSAIPIVWAFGWFLVIPVFCLEVYILWCIDSGVRLGDVMGNTLVTEYFEQDGYASN